MKSVFRVVAPMIALIMETASTSETAVNFYQTTRRILMALVQDHSEWRPVLDVRVVLPQA
jgi:hypothetical protein